MIPTRVGAVSDHVFPALIAALSRRPGRSPTTPPDPAGRAGLAHGLDGPDAL